jgi:hypothetical protein
MMGKPRVLERQVARALPKRHVVMTPGTSMMTFQGAR